VLVSVVLSVCFALFPAVIGAGASSRPEPAAGVAYLGFDTNSYPGDASVAGLRRTFSFIGYWLNDPPGGASIPWAGKRKILRGEGFGFLVLFNGRLERDLKTAQRAGVLGSGDARVAANEAIREGFRPGTVIFLDQEEGGEMEPDQMAYVLAWIDGVVAANFRAGVYCSGMPAAAGPGRLAVTAQNIRERAGNRKVTFFVYNDACPPSQGCVYRREAPPPAESGVRFASVWQFAQSPRRKQFTASCAATYDLDGNCHPPWGAGIGSIFLDLDSATSADPSDGR
jgi:hypothetical protein